jgi:hypothetical protein
MACSSDKILPIGETGAKKSWTSAHAEALLERISLEGNLLGLRVGRHRSNQNRGHTVGEQERGPLSLRTGVTAAAARDC